MSRIGEKRRLRFHANADPKEVRYDVFKLLQQGTKAVSANPNGTMHQQSLIR
jgi:hypothetical protein